MKVVERGTSRSEILLEAQIHSGLQHPNIVRLTDYFIEATCPILVLEYASGGTLQDKLTKQSNWSPSDVHRLMWQLANRAGARTRRGIVHRDLKPANILIGDANGSANYLVSDFGVGRRNVGIQTAQNCRYFCVYGAGADSRASYAAI